MNARWQSATGERSTVIYLALVIYLEHSVVIYSEPKSLPGPWSCKDVPLQSLLFGGERQHETTQMMYAPSWEPQDRDELFSSISKFQLRPDSTQMWDREY